MDQRIEKLSFCREGGEPFTLETRYYSDNPEIKHRKLIQRGKELKVERRPLDLLAFFLNRPKVDIRESELSEMIWGTRKSQLGGNVEQQVHKLRAALGDTNTEKRVFIGTISRHGYKFLLDVQIDKTPDKPSSISATSLQISERWEHERFYRFIKETTRGDDSDEDGDLRILTTAYSSGVPDVFQDLLEKDVRIKILFLSEELIRARNGARLEHSAEKALFIQKDQRDTMETWKKRSSHGSLDVLETDAMPCGIVLHNRQGALVGLFIATESYERGPMIEAGPNSRLWGTLLADWRKLWIDAETRAQSQKARPKL